MKALRILGLAVVAGLSACGPLDDIDLGGGGTGGGDFSRGFVFVKGSTTSRNVFAVDDSGDPNSPLQLTTQGGAYEPTVSRNGRLVAFVYKAGSTLELRRVPTTGQGQPSTVFASTNITCPGCTNLRFPTFSPDGNTLVFTVYKGTSSVLARVNADGSNFQFLPSGGFSYFGSASFFANGQSVLATAGTQGDQYNTLLQVPLNGGAPNPIAYSLGNEALYVVNRAVVSPDGSKVAFDGRISSGGSRIFVAPIGQQLGSVTMVTDYVGESVEDRFPSWRGNTELGFLSNSGGADQVYRISATALRGTGNLMVPGAMEPFYGGGL
jgi:Tol biopolymer transport system component